MLQTKTVYHKLRPRQKNLLVWLYDNEPQFNWQFLILNFTLVLGVARLGYWSALNDHLFTCNYPCDGFRVLWQAEYFLGRKPKEGESASLSRNWKQLEERGLVIRYQEGKGKPSYLKLTQEGEHLAQKLQNTRATCVYSVAT